MKDFYFTFGQDQHQSSLSEMNPGMMMKNYWVRVTASSYNWARLYFVEKFSTLYMNRPLEWSFQYAEKDFIPAKHHFPKGEYMHLTTPEGYENPIPDEEFN
jgi:hypothetical protein